MSKKSKKHKTDIQVEERHLKEVWALSVFFLALFVFMTNQYPHKMGLVGFGLVESFGAFMMGEGIFYLPLFILFIAGAIYYAPQNRRLRTGLLGILGSWIGFCIFIELLLTDRMGVITWPLPLDGGGVVGHLGAWVLIHTVGSYGTIVVLLALIIVSFVALFVSCFNHVLVFSTEDTQESNGPSQNLPSKWPSRLKSLVHLLFFMKKEIQSRGIINIE